MILPEPLEMWKDCWEVRIKDEQPKTEQEREQQSILERECNRCGVSRWWRDNFESDLRPDSLARRVNYILQAVGVSQSTGGLIPTYIVEHHRTANVRGGLEKENRSLLSNWCLIWTWHRVLELRLEEGIFSSFISPKILNSCMDHSGYLQSLNFFF